MPFPNKKLIALIVILAAVGIWAGSFLFKKEFRYTGTIEATRVDVPSRISSVIATLNTKEGDKVQTGQILLTMSCEDHLLNAKLANDNFFRAEQLLKDGSLSRQDYDSVQNKKDDADLKVSWCTAHSPLNGTVLTQYHEPGEMVNPGTKLFTLADIKDVYAYIYIPQPRVASLRLQQNVSGVLPEMTGRTFHGTITWISSEAEFTPKNVQTQEERTRLIYAVKVRFDNPDELLKPGMSIDVDLGNIKQ